MRLIIRNIKPFNLKLRRLRLKLKLGKPKRTYLVRQ
jgi:hypothetical protein